MSSYGMMHIGYYLIGEEREVAKSQSTLVCERDSSHKIKKSDNFCSECGGMVVSDEVQEIETPSFYDIPEDEFDGEMYDELYTPEYVSPKGMVIAISNQGAGCVRLDDDFSDILGLDDIDPEDLYNAFMDEHGEHVVLIEKHVLDNVEVKFGIFRYYM